MCFKLTDLITVCDEVIVNMTDIQNTNLTSPGYPNTPRSQLAYYCDWTIQIPQDMACFIEIKQFEGSEWFVVLIDTPESTVDRLLLHFNSTMQPSSVTIANHSVISLNLREEVIQPRRSEKEVFFANIIAKPKEDESNVFTNK